jgi:phosphatidylserine/phosphatidylglycerophosphate/cardiolipin synthase-like enzyme
LGLPRADELSGLEMVVKSIFVRPFSVMHPKFILVDRKIAFMPSCNVSWEDWFEGCIEMRGDITLKLYDFWAAFWGRGEASLSSLPADFTSPEPTAQNEAVETSLIKQISFPQDAPPIQSILLPSPHHANRILHPLSSLIPPPTPLNTFILHILNTATKSIFIQTPNLTCTPLISALFSALGRGIDLHLITSSRLMILEQLVTAGTITEFEIWKLRRRYSRLLNAYNLSLGNPDLENPSIKPGVLKVGYFRKRKGIEGGKEPVKSHLKMVAVDGEITLLGSGNMDRASWFTSQELGVALIGREVAEMIRGAVDEGLEGRVVYVH